MQRINLYNELERKLESPLSARRQLQYLGVLTAFMLLVTIGVWLSNSSIRGDLNELEAMANESHNIVAQLKETIKTKSNDSALQRELERLERDIQFRQQLLLQVEGRNDDDINGFSEYLAGLGRQSLNGIWFERIELNEGGERVALVGQTHRPELLPEYLRRLANEPVFAGQHFSVLKLNAEEESDTLSFTVRAQASEALQ